MQDAFLRVAQEAQRMNANGLTQITGRLTRLA